MYSPEEIARRKKPPNEKPPRRGKHAPSQIAQQSGYNHRFRGRADGTLDSRFLPMGYQVLARKYRPQRFADVVGQDHVTRTLLNAL